jgi:hypothetical protein
MALRFASGKRAELECECTLWKMEYKYGPFQSIHLTTSYCSIQNIYRVGIHILQLPCSILK